VSRLHEHIANQRRDGWHKTTRCLVASYGVIVLEDLSLRFMLQNGHFSRSAHDVGLGLFRTLLDDKAIQAGVEIVTVNPKHTSQVCSGCRKMVLKDLSVRVHECPDCGLKLDRDVVQTKFACGSEYSWARTEPTGANVAHWGGRSRRSSPALSGESRHYPDLISE